MTAKEETEKASKELAESVKKLEEARADLKRKLEELGV